jgi:propionyl-CoA carboxylase alpha chain
MSKFLISPMPGLLKSLSADIGDRIDVGVELAVIEAMKMENVLKAPRTGKVAKLLAKPGETLSVGQVIMEFE